MKRSHQTKRIWIRYVCVALLGFLTITLLYLFGWITFSNPEKQLKSNMESDRFDALITIAEQGPEAIAWRPKVIQAMKTDPSPDIREMASITLRELGPSEASIKALESCLATETNKSVRASLQEVLDSLQSE